MLRLTLLLSAAMLAALMTLGEDRGQLRPGLALAEAEGRLDEVWAEARAKAAPAVAPEAAPVLAGAEAEIISEPEVVAAPAPILASAAPVIQPDVEVQPGREVIARVEEPVFSLASLGNEAVPGEEGTPVAEATPEVLPGTEGTIWYVNASSVNVRAAPSTEAEVLGKLGSGEAALMVAAVDGEWARIVIQGDGLEGFVALRYLSAEAP